MIRAPAVFVNLPKLLAVMLLDTALKLVWLRLLNISARIWNPTRSLIANLLPMEKSTFQRPGRRMAPFPRFPGLKGAPDALPTGTLANAALFRYWRSSTPRLAVNGSPPM